MEGIIMMAGTEFIRSCGTRKPDFYNTSVLFIYYLFISFLKTNNNASLKMRVAIKKSVQNKRWVKLTESGIDRKIIELLKSYTGLISSLASLYFTLMKYVWSRENARKQKSHELGKEAKTEIVYLNSTE